MSERALIELLYGSGAHANTLACVEDLPLEFAGRRADNFPHSIWQLVNHMNFWMAYELKRIGNEKPVYPTHASESWPTNGASSSEGDWQEAITRFRDLLAKLARLADSPPDRLSEEVGATHPDHAKRSWPFCGKPLSTTAITSDRLSCCVAPSVHGHPKVAATAGRLSSKPSLAGPRLLLRFGTSRVGL